jgi:hypothetical protein
VDIQPEDVRGRSATDRLLPHSPADALKVARAIRHPWYRCQALSAVGNAIESRAEALRVLNESLSAAHEQAEPNRVVTVAAWPLRHLLRLDRVRTAKEVEELLGLASTEPHGLRRLHALDSLLGAVAEDPSLRGQVAEVYLNTAHNCSGWRTERTIAFMAQHLVALDPSLAKRLLAGRAPSRFVRHAIQAIEAHESGSNA